MMILFYYLISLVFAQETNWPVQCSGHSHPDINEPILINNPLPYLPLIKPQITSNSEAPSSFELDMKLLVLSSTNNPAEEPTIDLIKTALNSYHIPFDHLVLTTNGRRNSESLISFTNSDGSGKYYGVITTTGQLSFKNEKGIIESALTTEQWGQLEKYEKDYRIRRVSLYSFPHEGLGVNPSDGFLSPENTSISLNRELKDDLDFDNMGLRREIKIPASKVWFYPTQLKEGNLASPFLFFDYEGKKNVGGIISTFPDQRKQMHFFFSQDQNFLPSQLMPSVWINWVTKGVYQGKRRIYFNIQVDDFFLSTRLFDPFKIEIYRLSPNELSTYINWQKGVMQTLADNPRYKIELAFNGWGVLDNGTTTADQLYLYSRSRLEEFNWISHTFSHPILNDMSFAPIDLDLKKNIEFAENFFGPFKNYFSPHSIVTPGISGLFNKEAIRAMMNNQILFAIGDNSIANLVPLKPYHARYTTDALNGLSGLLIVPRHPTQIYFNVSTPKELVAQYNIFYPQFNGKADLEQIYATEVKRVSKLLYFYDHSAHMFHQANLRAFDYESAPASLLSIWMKKTMHEVRNYLTLPILSEKMDQQAQLFQERMELDDCAAKARIVINNLKIISLKMQASKNCKIAFTGITPVTSTEIMTEKYGPDHTTYANPFQTSLITLKIPLNF